MGRNRFFPYALTFVVAISITSEANAENTGWDLGLRANVLLGDGLPANDILGAGVIVRFHKQDGWIVGATLDSYDYDFEHIARIVGIVQDPAQKSIDAAASNAVVGGFLGHRYGDASRGFGWFWTAGLGLGFPDVKDQGGPTDDGGTFDIMTDAKTEYHLMGTLGTSYHFTPSWSASFAARLEHHVMDVTVTDRVTGATRKIDSQSPYGAYLSLNYRFK